MLSRWENTTNRQGVEQLRVSFGSSFFYFPLKVVGGHVRSNDSPVIYTTCKQTLLWPVLQTDSAFLF